MEILFKLRENLLNIGIAGINLIEQDFRLKNNIEELGNICENIPPLKKVHSLCLNLLQEENKITIYLDLLALIDAILITQGKNIKTENLEEINTYDLDVQENLYSQVQSAIIAFSTKFSGRTEEIKNILEMNNKIILDYRVINYAINALQDNYSEIPILIKDCFKEIGDEKVVNILKEDFALKGKSMVYRLEIIGSICKEKENDFYLSLLEKSKGDLKKEVIKCLSYDKSNKDLLLDLYKNRNKTKANADNLMCIIFSLIKIEYENESFIKENFIENLSSLCIFLEDECMGCSCINCKDNKSCSYKDKKCQKDCPINKEPIDISDYDNSKYNTIINYLNENIKYGESDLLGNIYAELLENYLKIYEKKLNLINFIEKPIQNKRFFIKILKDLCGFYGDKLEEVYFKYLNSNNKFIQLLLSEMLVYSILLTNDERFIKLAFKISEKDKEEMFISSYFLASLLTKPAKEVFEKFSEKVFPKKANNMEGVDKIIYETKVLNLQMLLSSIKYKDNKHMICVNKNKNVHLYSSDWEELTLSLYENIYFAWFKFLCNNNRLIFSFRKEDSEIFFYEVCYVYELEEFSELEKSNIIGFLMENSSLYNNKEIGTYIYNYILENINLSSLELMELFLKYLEVINNCGVESCSYLINQYLTKNLAKILNRYNKNYYLDNFIEFFNNMNNDNFTLIKNELILQLNEILENLKDKKKNKNTEDIKDEIMIKNNFRHILDAEIKTMLNIIKNNFGYILNQ